MPPARVVGVNALHISLLQSTIMMNHSLFKKALGLLLFCFWTLPIYAHAPSLHKFALVDFKRPFPAPAFSLKNLEGNDAALNDFQGNYVLLNFWATWCVPCLKEMPSMQQLYQRYQEKNFTIVAVSIDTDTKDKVPAFVEKLKLTFPILLDPNNQASKVYGVKDLPSSFLLSPEGKVIAAAKGERDWFSEEALSYLDELIGFTP